MSSEFTEVASAATSTSTPDATPSPSEAPELSILDQIRAASDSATAAASAGTESGEGTTPEEKPVAAAEAPAEGQAAVPAEPQQTAEEQAESYRQRIKSSNLPADQKEILSDLVYKGQAFEQLGYKIDDLRNLKDLGITPQVLTERVQIHPTIESERMDATLAGEHRELINDIRNSPDTFLEKLYAANPDMANKLIENAADKLPYVNRAKVVQARANNFRETLNLITADATKEGNLDLQEAARIIIERAFGPQGAAVQQQNQNDPYRRQLVELQNKLKYEQTQRASQEQTSRAAFVQSFGATGDAAMLQEVTNAVVKATPTWDADLRQRAINDVYAGVQANLFARKNIMTDLGHILTGPLNQDTFNRALKFSADNARPLIPQPLKTALETWGKYSVAKQASKEVIQAKAVSKVDVGRVTGTATPGAAPPSIDAQVLAEGKKQNWGPLEMMQRKQELMASR